MYKNIDDKIVYAKDLRPSTAKKVDLIIDMISEIARAEYERGKEDEKRWWSGFCANCTDGNGPQGKWIDCKGGWKCTACNKWSDGQYVFCPYCGAKMKGVNNV